MEIRNIKGIDIEIHMEPNKYIGESVISYIERGLKMGHKHCCLKYNGIKIGYWKKCPPKVIKRDEDLVDIEMNEKIKPNPNWFKRIFFKKEYE